MKSQKQARISFAKIPSVLDLPYLLEIQKKSYDDFLQFDVPPMLREDIGLQELFKEVFPITCPGELSTLEFVEYSFGREKYTPEECIERGMTYGAPLRVKLQLILRERNEETGEIEIKDIKEQEVYLGEIPLMTDKGTFIINGAERVIVSQLHRSPGVSFSQSTHPTGKTIYSARIIPYRGAWLEFEVDVNNILMVLVDRKRRMPATMLLRALGADTDEKIAREFYPIEKLSLSGYKKGTTRVSKLEQFIGEEFVEPVISPKTGQTIVEKGEKVTRRVIEQLEEHGVKEVYLSKVEGFEHFIGRLLAKDIIDTKTGEVIAECFDPVTTNVLNKCVECGIKTIEVIVCEYPETDVILSTLRKDKVKTYDDALLEFFKRMRPGNPVNIYAAHRLVEDMFFNVRRYDLGKVGRYKLNRRLRRPTVEGPRHLTLEDVIDVIKLLIRLQREQLEVDDIDHLGNRRVRSVGELLQNQLRLAFIEVERTARERMNIAELDSLMPQNLINAKPIIVAIKDFFGRSQLSQFMDQTNPLAELTHKRRLSALGPGGLSRERAGFEVRDVHHTHYGRICPIETPEGPNIGLIQSLASYARVNEFGFIESPYRKVVNGKVLNEVEYLTADMEDEHKIAQANAPIDEEGRFIRDRVLCRYRGDFPLVSPSEVEYMDVSPLQMVSISAALIPFLEHDDANRALMGSNMQRQAVPLLFQESPIVGTGIEEKVARDSGACVIAQNSGIVEEVSAEKIVIRTNDGRRDLYLLKKFQRSNQNTCINQKPIVSEGETVKKGQIIADGPATKDGELALGRNVLVAFMSWGGYNFEDAILISERVVKDDVFTSIHIEEFQVDARDTKQGKEEITCDIPNISEEMLSKLDENGIIRVGLEVKPGDILVGKISPKGETELTSEEKLLRAIFGEKASDVKDSSLRVPPGIYGTVVDVKVFTRKERNSRTERRDKEEIEKVNKQREEQLKLLEKEFDEKLIEILTNHLRSEILDFETGKVILRPGERITDQALKYIKHCLRTGMLPVEGKCGDLVKKLYQEMVIREREIEDRAKNQIERIKGGDELSHGVNKMVKVYIAQRRKISVGDKLAGRHGNKGVIAKILPEEDMPFLEDGTPVDIVLNPLGVPSRMNVGQIFETILGWAGKVLGVKFASPVFDGAREEEIKEYLKKAGLPEDGQTVLYDGLTGEPFDQKVTVGYIYMMKLNHMVDDKMHARAIGPYSIVTQQPLGGKAQFGGQRFGEMEVWALEGYGAAYTLQEMLTVKSDDVVGRSKIYESIIKGQNVLQPGIPESFNVLVKEIQSLGLNFELLTETEETEEEESALKSSFLENTDEGLLSGPDEPEYEEEEI